MNLDALAYHLDGSPVIIASKPKAVNETPGQEHATWKRLACEALLANYPSDKDMSLSEKCLIARLARRIERGGEMTFKAENVVLIKERVGKGWVADIVLQLTEKLDPKEAEFNEDNL